MVVILWGFLLRHPEKIKQVSLFCFNNFIVFIDTYIFTHICRNKPTLIRIGLRLVLIPIQHQQFSHKINIVLQGKIL